MIDTSFRFENFARPALISSRAVHCFQSLLVSLDSEKFRPSRSAIENRAVSVPRFNRPVSRGIVAVSDSPFHCGRKTCCRACAVEWLSRSLSSDLASSRASHGAARIACSQTLPVFAPVFHAANAERSCKRRATHVCACKHVHTQRSVTFCGATNCQTRFFVSARRAEKR